MPISTRNSKILMLLAAFITAVVVSQLARLAAWASNSPPADPASSKSSSGSSLVPSVNSLEAIAAPPPSMPSSAEQAHYIGAGSCAARACHGSPVLTRRGESNSAYNIWIANDPHAQAYAVLFTPESQRMAQALNLGNSADAAAKADRCLACHSLPVTGSHANNASGDVSSLLSDGVSCEACHGPAEKYLVAHTTKDWRPPSDPKFDPSFGMTNTADIAGRAKVCVGCHVGQPDAQGHPWRDVNHDLIAAGHPRLNFDFTAYMANLPQHWNVHKNPERFDETRSLIVGQFVSADAALKLLESRASAAAASPALEKGINEKANAKPSRDTQPFVTATWPELSEYDCFSCHHELRGKSWRQQMSHPEGNPLRQETAQAIDQPEPKRGSPGWGTWYYQTPRILAATSAVVDRSHGTAWLNSLNELTLSMQTPSPNASKVAEQAKVSDKKLSELWSAAPILAASASGAADSQALRTALLKSLADEFHHRRPSDWDEFVQYYLDLVAIDQSQSTNSQNFNSRPVQHNDADLQGRQKSINEVLQAIRNRLSFPADDQGTSNASTESPVKNDTASHSSSILHVLRPGFNSPLKFDPDAKQADAPAGDPAGKSLVELFDEAFQLLGKAPLQP